MKQAVSSSGSGRRRHRYHRHGSAATASREPRFRTWFVAKILMAALFCVAVGVVLIGHARQGRNHPAGSDDVFWQSDGTTALLAEARAALSAEPPDFTKAEATAQAALFADPLNFSALSLLAQVRDGQGDAVGAASLRRLILARTQRDTDTELWLLRQSVEDRDLAGFVKASDALLRGNRRPDLRPSILGALRAVASDPAAIAPLVEVLQLNPPWRYDFLRGLATEGALGAYPSVMQALSVEDAPWHSPDYSWSHYLRRLIDSGAANEAYALWTGLLPPDTPQLSPLYNGGFEQPPSGLPFDWRISPLKGVVVALDPEAPAAGSNALQVSFSGTPVRFQHLEQFLLLTPGNYSLSGQVQSRNLVTERGLRWRLYCWDAGKGRLVAETRSFRGTAPWSPFELSFAIPDANCDAQLLRLELPARIAAERRISGRIWFDDMAISRLAESSGSS